MKRFLSITRLLQDKGHVRYAWLLFACFALLLFSSSVFALIPVSSCQDITVSGSYQLTTDLTNCSITITANNVDFDLNSHTIAGGVGIFSPSWPPPDDATPCSGFISGVVIRNGKLPVGIGLGCVENIRISSIQITNTVYGISGHFIRNSVFDSNDITCMPATGYPNPENTYGMIIFEFSNNQMFLNTISACSYGMQMGVPPPSYFCNGNQLLYNEFSGNDIGIMMSGNNNTLTNNKFDQKDGGLLLYAGGGNLIINNDSKGGLSDFSTYGVDCGSNIWLNNKFKYASPSCIQ